LKDREKIDILFDIIGVLEGSAEELTFWIRDNYLYHSVSNSSDRRKKGLRPAETNMGDIIITLDEKSCDLVWQENDRRESLKYVYFQ
jgi:hypothetical protein